MIKLAGAAKGSHRPVALAEFILRPQAENQIGAGRDYRFLLSAVNARGNYLRAGEHKVRHNIFDPRNPRKKGTAWAEG